MRQQRLDGVDNEAEIGLGPARNIGRRVEPPPPGRRHRAVRDMEEVASPGRDGGGLCCVDIEAEDAETGFRKAQREGSPT